MLGAFGLQFLEYADAFVVDVEDLPHQRPHVVRPLRLVWEQRAEIAIMVHRPQVEQTRTG